jgi:hypothetical protein
MNIAEHIEFDRLTNPCKCLLTIATMAASLRAGTRRRTKPWLPSRPRNGFDCKWRFPRARARGRPMNFHFLGIMGSPTYGPWRSLESPTALTPAFCWLVSVSHLEVTFFSTHCAGYRLGR